MKIFISIFILLISFNIFSKEITILEDIPGEGFNIVNHSKVKVHYVGLLEDGSEFDNSYEIVDWHNLGALERWERPIFINCTMPDGSISKAHVTTALRGAVLRGADLSSVYLGNLDLSGADLSGADLSGA